ncbi:hypothetical protein HAX54_035311, partial [Datura stramonium]|nr:hypothetical protein [Datura stramonium]
NEYIKVGIAQALFVLWHMKHGQGWAKERRLYVEHVISSVLRHVTKFGWQSNPNSTRNDKLAKPNSKSRRTTKA